MVLTWSTVERAAVGVRLLDLLIDQPAWIARRIEQVEWADDRTLWRTSVIDVRSPASTRTGAQNDEAGSHSMETQPPPFPLVGNRLLLPIAMFERRASRNVTVTSAAQEPLPHLTRSEERALVAAGLTTWVSEMSGDAFDDIPVSVREAGLAATIEVGASLPGLELPGEWLHLRKRADRLADYVAASRDEWSHFVEHRVVVALPEASELGANDGRLRIIERHPEEFPRAPEPRRISPLFRVPIAQEEGPTAIRVLVTDPVVGPIRYMAGDTTIDRPVWERSCSLDDAPISIVAGSLGEAASYHLEVTCPAGMFIETSKLVVTRVSGDTSDEIDEAYGGPTVVGGVEVWEIDEDDPRWDTAHFYYSASYGQEEGTDPPEILESVAALILRPMYHGVLRAGTNVSILTTALLATLTLSLGWEAGGLPTLVELPLVQRDTNSVVSLLLLVPTIALAVLLRADEPLLTKWVMSSYRQRLAVVGLANFVAAVAFAIGLDGLWLTATLVVATCVSAVYSYWNYRSGEVSRARERLWLADISAASS